MSCGGYGDYVRAPGHFVVPIPGGLDSAGAAPILCAGITVFSPLKRSNCGPKTRVGIAGIGGLGHFGIFFAKAMGTKAVVAISGTSGKKEDDVAMGAIKFIAMDEENGWTRRHARSPDLIICTVSSPKMPLDKYLKPLPNSGQFIQVGAPEDHLLGFSAFSLIAKDAKIGGSCIGPPWEIEETLKFAEEMKIGP